MFWYTIISSSPWNRWPKILWTKGKLLSNHLSFLRRSWPDTWYSIVIVVKRNYQALMASIMLLCRYTKQFSSTQQRWKSDTVQAVWVRAWSYFSWWSLTLTSTRSHGEQYVSSLRHRIEPSPIWCEGSGQESQQLESNQQLHMWATQPSSSFASLILHRSKY